jgi:peptidoglycan/LPS O-acetylase OafA/YrhL
MNARDIQAFVTPFPQLLLVTVVGTVTIATMSYFIVEKPALARRARSFSRR